MKKKYLYVASALVASVALLGCGDDKDDTSGGIEVDADGNQTITGSLSEWKVEVSSNKAKAGQVTFVVDNNGTIGHEFLVVKTDIKSGQIPIEEGDRFSEENPDLVMIDEIGEYAKGTTETLTVTLDPGTYQLVCNLAAHYGAGMHTDFVVEA